MSDYNSAYLDEQTKRMIRRVIPMPYGWGTGYG